MLPQRGQPPHEVPTGKNLQGKGDIMTNETNVEKMGSELKDRFSSVLDSAKTTYQRIQENTVAGAKVADKTIRQHPYESIGIAAGLAFGLGLLIGVLAGRR
jgi:ElaB/YqjD/DUF883 family membrane-anchored ribosome-binding protein